MGGACGTVVSQRWDKTREEMKVSTGQLLPGARLRVIDAGTGALLGAGADGELAVAGPTIIDRYVGKAREESPDADGFLPTGDMGFVTGGGAVHCTGPPTAVPQPPRSQ